MLEVYKIAAKHMWTWLKRFAIALGVMLPGLILIAYMVITEDIDIRWRIVFADFVAIILWSPIPLYPMYRDEYTMSEAYKRLFSDIFASTRTAIALVTVVYGYVAWVCLPVVAGLIAIAIMKVEPAWWQCGLVILGNLLWGPGAHHLYTKLVKRFT